MSVRTMSPKASSVKPYKKLLLEAEKLRAEGGKAAFKLATILVRIYEDQEFRSDFVIDDFKAIDVLDNLCQHLCLNFRQLQVMLEYYPNSMDWSDGKLATMHQTILDRRHQPAPKVVTRRSVKVQEHEDVKKELRQARAFSAKKVDELERLRAENKVLKEENTRLREENRLLKQQVHAAAA